MFFLCSNVAAQQMEIVGSNSMDNLIVQRITTMAATNGYKLKRTEGTNGPYIVVGQEVPSHFLVNLLESLSMKGNSSNVVMANDTRKYNGRSKDIIVGVSYNKDEIPSTKPISPNDLKLLRNESWLTTNYLRSIYKPNTQINEYGIIYDTDFIGGMIVEKSNTIGNNDNKTEQEWMADIAKKSLEILSRLISNAESLDNYINIENQNTESTIEKIALRNRFIFDIISQR